MPKVFLTLTGFVSKSIAVEVGGGGSKKDEATAETAALVELQEFAGAEIGKRLPPQDERTERPLEPR